MMQTGVRGNVLTSVTRALDIYGPQTEAIVAVEELSELQKEITKKLRYPNRTNIFLTEEIADVLICIETLKVMYGITSHDILEMVDQKVARNQVRMDMVNRVEDELEES